MPFTAADDNDDQVRLWYELYGRPYPAEFTCFMVVDGRPKLEWIGAFGNKRKSNFRRIEASEEHLSDVLDGRLDVSKGLDGLFGAGVVIEAHESVFMDLDTAAAGDYSDLAARKRQVELVRLDGPLEQRMSVLSTLIKHAEPGYCDARMNRALHEHDIAQVFKLSEFETRI